MKKLSYLIVGLLVSLAINAQTSYWQPGYEATFDNWLPILDDDGNPTGRERPKGWHIPWNEYWLRIGDPTVKMTPTDDRFGNERSACRIETAGITVNWATWYIALKPMHWATAEDYNPIFIDNTEDFYYTFWAKSDVDGTLIHIGAAELYNPDNGVWKWTDLPSFELTTEWQQYGFQEYAFMDLTSFEIHLRDNGVIYLDDIELKSGQLPELPPNSIADVTSENVIKVLSSTNGVEIESEAGKVSVYDMIGNRIVADYVVAEGNNFIPVMTKGLHILQFEGSGNKVMVKTVVK